MFQIQYKMLYPRIIILTLLFFQLSCTDSVQINRSIDESSKVFQELLDESLTGSGNNNCGTSMTVISSDLDIKWSGTSGHDSTEKKDSLLIKQPFRIASVTKTFVASTILRMEEEAMLSLSDPISKYVDSTFLNMLEDDGYQPELITIHHCLTNTSGLYNYAQGGRSYIDRIMSDPKHKWDRKQQLQHAIEYGSPVGKPGERYHYSDTGYILLGHIIEKITADHYGAAMRLLLDFDGLELNDTWLETIEDTPVGALRPVRRYHRRDDCTHLDASVDLFGGGGLMSSTQDLAIFFHALFNEGVFKNEETLQNMIAKESYGIDYNPAEDKKYLDYRKGVYHISIFGMDAYMHSGFWGTVFIHVPDLNTTIAADAVNGSTDRLLKKTILYIKNVQNQN